MKVKIICRNLQFSFEQREKMLQIVALILITFDFHVIIAQNKSYDDVKLIFVKG